jgi:hypothetical protein
MKEKSIYKNVLKWNEKIENLKKTKKPKNLQVQMQWSLSLQSWRWCLRCCSVVVSSKGMHKVEQNYTHIQKKPHQVPQVQMQYSFIKCFSLQV